MANLVLGKKAIFTINYKEQEEKTNEDIKECLEKSLDIEYVVFQKEQGQNGTIHHQGFIIFNKSVRLGKVINLFKDIGVHPHIMKPTGTNKQNFEYCTGTGIHDYKRTNVSFEDSGGIALGNYVELGILPQDKEKKKKDLDVLIELIKQGKTLIELNEFATENEMLSTYLRNQNNLEKLYLQEQSMKWRKNFRHLNVRYLSGSTGVGKTRYVMEKYGYENVYRVTNYKNMWDGYKGEPVVIFEEFRNSISLEEMLVLLDGYPTELNARFSNRYACYTEIYLISNWDFEDQFKYEQDKEKASYEAFKRRFDNGCIGNLEEIKKHDYATNIVGGIELPI